MGERLNVGKKTLNPSSKETLEMSKRVEKETHAKETVALQSSGFTSMEAYEKDQGRREVVRPISVNSFIKNWEKQTVRKSQSREDKLSDLTTDFLDRRFEPTTKISLDFLSYVLLKAREKLKNGFSVAGYRKDILDNLSNVVAIAAEETGNIDELQFVVFVNKRLFRSTIHDKTVIFKMNSKGEIPSVEIKD